MPSGPGPDWGLITTDQVVGNTDLNELAARLQRGFGSGNRAGRVIWSTYFADGLAELIKRSAQGTGGSVALNTGVSEFGKQSVKLTAGNASGNQTSVGVWRPGGYASKIGFEWTVYNNILTNNTYRWYSTMSIFPGGSSRKNLSLRIDYRGNTNKDTQIAWYSATSTYTVAQTIDQEIVGQGFNSIKWIVDMRDPANPKYDKMLLNGQLAVDLSAKNVVVDTDTFKRPPGILFEVTFENRVAGVNPNCSIGSLIMTIDEP